MDSSSVTLQGNTFNGANQLVQLDGSGALPIISGANLTNVTATTVGSNVVGTTQIIDSPVALVDLNTTDVDTRYLTTGTDQTIGFAVSKRLPERAAPMQTRKVVCYQDSMHPWIKSDRPGKCTVCAMDLTPIYEGTQGFDVDEKMVC